MRRAGRWLAALLLLLALLPVAVHLWFTSGGAIPERSPGALRVATWNVHYISLRADEGRWSVSGWKARRGALASGVRALDADLIGFQEMESFGGGSASGTNLARDWLLEQAPGYALAAHGDDARRFPQTQPIFYRPAVLTLRDEGWFFFSATPDVIYSRTFNGSWPAFCSWALFEDRQGRRLRVLNLHFEYRSGSNRLKSAALVAERAAPWIEAGETVLVLADLNALHGSRTMAVLEAAGVRFARVPGASYHLDRGLHLFGAIDHIGTAGALRLATAPRVVQRRFDGVWPADHHPVLADVVLP